MKLTEWGTFLWSHCAFSHNDGGLQLCLYRLNNVSEFYSWKCP